MVFLRFLVYIVLLPFIVLKTIDGHKRALRTTSNIRDVFDKIQKINKENCGEAKDADKILDIRLDYSRWDSYTFLALYIANKMTMSIEQDGGTLEPKPNSYFFDLTKQVVITGRQTIFASAAIVEPGMFDRQGLFSAYAFRNTQGISVSNVANDVDFREIEGYQLLKQRSLTNIMEVSTKTKQGDSITAKNILYATKENALWSRPYFDCGGGNIWMITFFAPVFSRDTTGSPKFEGSGTIDVAIKDLDVNQCDSVGKSTDAFINAFRGTHKCPSYTKCVFKPGFGFRPGGYICLAKNGCILVGSLVENASIRKLSKMKRVCRRFRQKKGYKKQFY